MLIIEDRRPTALMALCVAGSLLCIGIVIFSFFGLGNWYDSSLLWVVGLPAVITSVYALRGSIREVYAFDKATGNYSFTWQFVFSKEVIEGSSSQFCGVGVRTKEDDEGNVSHFVALLQEGIFLHGVSEQRLREDIPLGNSYENEMRIVTAISEF